MRISAEMFQQTLAALRSEPRLKDRRQNPRVGLRCPLQIVLREKKGVARTVKVCLHDISCDGIGILHHRKIPVGAKYVVQLPRKEDGPALTLLCTVVSIRDVGDGLWSIGAKFTEVVPSTRAPEDAAADASPGGVADSAASMDEKQTLAAIQAAVLS